MTSFSFILLDISFELLKLSILLTILHNKIILFLQIYIDIALKNVFVIGSLLGGGSCNISTVWLSFWIPGGT